MYTSLSMLEIAATVRSQYMIYHKNIEKQTSRLNRYISTLLTYILLFSPRSTLIYPMIDDIPSTTIMTANDLRFHLLNVIFGTMYLRLIKMSLRKHACNVGLLRWKHPYKKDWIGNFGIILKV